MPVAVSTFPITLATANTSRPDWQLGQRLEAVVVRSHATGDPTQVRIGAQTIALRLPTALPEGRRISLQVTQAGAQPILRLLSSPAHLAPNAAASAPTAPPWLSQLLPAQGSQTPLLAALTTLHRQPETMALLPQDVRASLGQLWQQLPTIQQTLHAAGLHQAVQTSGLFHESLLANLALGQTGHPPANLKSALLALATRLRAHTSMTPAQSTLSGREVPPPRPGASPVAQSRVAAQIAGLNPQALLAQLSARTEQAVARLSLHQWSSTETSESQQPRWLFELPLRGDHGIDVIHWLIQRDRAKQQAEDEPAVWRVELALDWPELGPLHIHISLSGQQVSARLWAEHESTLVQVQQALPQLRQALTTRQLQIGHLGCHLGKPPTPVPDPIDPPLVDDHA
jgi:hypothetical protein